MIPVASPYPPGVILVVTGELTRYAKFMQDLHALSVPRGSGILWMCSPLVKRNIDTGLQRFLDTAGMQWVWLIGDDHSFPRDIVLKLLSRGKECVVPACLNRQPPITATICRRENTGSTSIDQFPKGLYKLAANETSGDAGMLLSRRAVEISGPPWQDMPDCGTWNVEDQRFSAKLHDLGVERYYDFDNPIGHITPVKLWPVHEGGQWRLLLKSGGKRLI